MSRRGKIAEPPSNSFQVMFTSLAVILLAFFILLNSLASLDDKRQRKALGSLTAVFSGLGTGPLVPRGGALLEIGDQMGVAAEGAGQLAKKIIDKILVEEGLSEQMEYIVDGNDVLLLFADHIVFDLGKAVLKTRMTQILEVIAGVIRQTGRLVVVEGHTDNVPIHTVLYESNWELSTARAGAVVRYLIEDLEVPPDEVSGEGRGEFKPIADNSTPEGRAKNRRVVIRFVGLAAEEANVTGMKQELQKQE